LLLLLIITVILVVVAFCCGGRSYYGVFLFVLFFWFVFFFLLPLMRMTNVVFIVALQFVTTKRYDADDVADGGDVGGMRACRTS